MKFKVPSRFSSSYIFHISSKTTLTVLCLAFFFICDIPVICGQHSGDDCNWSGSGLSNGIDERGIQPVYLRCSEGKIEWKYPRGGLRVILKHGTSGKDFKGCIRANRDFSGARIYLEGHRTLHPLYSKNDLKHYDLPRCFVSHRGQVALYIESNLKQDSLNKSVAQFDYDLQLRNKDNLVDEQEDCRPCTDDEMLLSYCTSDFVIQGEMTNIFNNKDLERSEISIRSSKVVRETRSVVKSASNAPKDTKKTGTLHVPLKCGAEIDEGHFLFLGRIVLGNPVLQCAPRMEDWMRIRARALKEFKNQCQLD